MDRKKFTTIYLLTAPFFWATNFIISKVLVQQIPPVTLVTIRFSVAAFLLLLILKRYEGFSKPKKEHYLPLAIMGLTGVMGFNSLLYAGLQYTTTTNSAIINGLYPLFATVLAVIFTGESFNIRKLIGISSSLIGVLLLIVYGSPNQLLALHVNYGDILVVIATFCWAIYSLVGKAVMRDLSPLCVTTYASLAGLLFLYPSMLVELNHGARVNFTWAALLGVVYIGIFASALAHVLWNLGIQQAGPEKAGYFINLLPVYVAFLANIFLGENIYWYHLVGTGLVLLGTRMGTSDKVVSNR